MQRLEPRRGCCAVHRNWSTTGYRRLIAEHVEQVRLGIVAHLECISSEQEQLDYEQNVPIANVSSKMICVWFDSLYWPESTNFKLAFDASERAVLAAFNTFFDQQEYLLPETDTIKTWRAVPIWRQIMQRAEETIQLLHR